MEDRDWLESRMAAESYIPDDGFTARVVGRLPQRRASAFSRRMAILCCAGFIAFCLFLWQLPPLMQSANHFLASPNFNNVPALLNVYLREPMTLFGASAALILLGFAAIPFLRRWA